MVLRKYLAYSPHGTEGSLTCRRNRESSNIERHGRTLGYIRYRCMGSTKHFILLVHWLAIEQGPSTWNMLQTDLHPLSCLTGGGCVVDNY